MNIGNEGGFPVPPFPFIEIIICAYLAIILLSKKTISISNKNGEIYLALLITYSILSIALLPILFKGIGVFNPRLGIDAQVDSLSPLKFSISMIGQVAYLILNAGALYFASQINRNNLNLESLHKVVTTTALIVLFFAAWQGLSKATQLYFPSEIIYSNKFVSIGSEQTFSGINRLSSTFIEPSLFGLFAGAMATYFIYVSHKFFSKATAMHFMCATAAIASTSSTGIIALFSGYAIFALDSWFINRSTRNNKKVLLIIFFSVALGTISIALFGDSIEKILSAQLAEKMTTTSFTNRSASNDRAVELFVETHGLGVGLGGNRPSSLIAYLISNVGLVGTTLFLAFIFKTLKQPKTNHAAPRNNVSTAISRALIVTILGMTLSVPDISLYQLWFWIILISLTKRNHTNQYPISAKHLTQ
ncbi:MAG: hypothetical protein AB1664_02745 [Thermodesulfobacteriota bacterium]